MVRQLVGDRGPLRWIRAHSRDFSERNPGAVEVGFRLHRLRVRIPAEDIADEPVERGRQRSRFSGIDHADGTGWSASGIHCRNLPGQPAFEPERDCARYGRIYFALAGIDV
jgi:hypothetical protein